MLKIIKAAIVFINAIIILALIGIHFFIKDSTYDTSLFFYAFPLPIIIIVILVLSIFLTKKRRKYNLILAVVLLIIWLSRSFRISFIENVKLSDIEIVFWNASRDNNLEKVFMEADIIPDVLVLSEPKESNFKALQLKYPNYFFYKSEGEIEVFSKSPLLIIKDVKSKFRTSVVHFKTKGIEFYAIDVMGSTDVPRSWELNFVNSVVKNIENTVVLGDFNLPYESLLFKDIKENYNHFFSKNGNGFRETWLWNLPILSLDHIWISKDLDIINSRKINTMQSDHSMIKTVVRK